MDDFNNNSRRLGNAQDFLESFEWTDESLRDLESVNVERTHRLLCGNRVKSTIESGLVINQSIVNGYMHLICRDVATNILICIVIGD